MKLARRRSDLTREPIPLNEQRKADVLHDLAQSTFPQPRFGAGGRQSCRRVSQHVGLSAAHHSAAGDTSLTTRALQGIPRILDASPNAGHRCLIFISSSPRVRRRGRRPASSAVTGNSDKLTVFEAYAGGKRPSVFVDKSGSRAKHPLPHWRGIASKLV
jgi:hypothetical protein